MAEKNNHVAEGARKKFDIKSLASDIGKAATSAADSVSKSAVTVADKTKEVASKSQEAILGAIDQNGDGEVGIEDVIIMGLKVPSIRIDRVAFLQKELQTKFSQEVIDDAIAHNPLHAKIPVEVIDKIADEVIKYEQIYTASHLQQVPPYCPPNGSGAPDIYPPLLAVLSDASRFPRAAACRQQRRLDSIA